MPSKAYSAPFLKRTEKYKIVVMKNGEVIKEIDLLAKDNIEKLGYKDSVDRVIENW